MSNAYRYLVAAAFLLATLSLASPTAYGEEPKQVRPLEGERLRPLAAERIDTQMVLQAAAVRKLPASVSPTQREELNRVVAHLKAGRQEAANTSWRNFSQSYFSKQTPADPAAIVQWVLRESYLETKKDLASYADKVRFYNEQKKALRTHLADLRERSAMLRKGETTQIRQILLEAKFEKGKDAVRWGPGKTLTKVQLDAEIAKLDDTLKSISNDAQMANLDLQNMLQKQQQVMQTMSNISKMLHDTALAIIRKLGG